MIGSVNLRVTIDSVDSTEILDVAILLFITNYVVYSMSMSICMVTHEQG